MFFDDVGWPWPKHPCTDSGAEVTVLDRPALETSEFQNPGFHVYLLRRCREGTNRDLKISLRNVESMRSIDILIKPSDNISEIFNRHDILEAPSFVLGRTVTLNAKKLQEMRFVCVRLLRVMTLKFRRVH